MKNQLLLFLFLFTSFIGLAQGEYNNWCFGAGIQLDFNSGSPIKRKSKLTNSLSSSSISDKDGNLLFYLTSNEAYNGSHLPLLNSAPPLPNNLNQLQSINTLPFPCNDSMYYVFSIISEYQYPQQGTHLKLEYSIVNMNRNGGLGEVTHKSIPVDSNIAGGFAMARHANNRDYWIMYQMVDTNIYHARHISPSGIGSAVISQGGHNQTNWGLGGYGGLKFSSDAKQLINCGGYDKFIDHFDFNNNTGGLSNYYSLNIPPNITSVHPFNSQFSPDLSKLYITGIYCLIQYDFSNSSPTAISNSGVSLANYSDPNTTLSNFRDIALGPNNIIYISRGLFNVMATINAPNNLGAACDFVNQGFNCNATTGIGFPTMLPNLFVHRNVLTDSLFCQYDTINLFLSDTNFIDSLVWDFGDPNSGSLNTSKDVVPLHVFDTYGLYPIEVIIYSGCSTDTINDTIRINPTPIANLGNDTILCEGEQMQLQFNDTSFNYLWSTADTSMQIEILQADTFSIAISSICGTDYDTIVIDSLIPALVHLPADTLMCNNDSLFLDATIQGGSYVWSNAVSLSNQWVTMADTFWVTATNFCGISSDTIVTTYTHTPNFNLGVDTALCIGDTLVLNAYDTLSHYLWSTTDTFALDTITTNGIYTVTTTNICGSFSDTIQAWFLDAPMVNIGTDTVICLGDSIALSDTSLFASYAWNTTSVTDTLWVKTAGIYQLTATNKCGSNADTISVETDTIPTINLGSDTVICQGASVALSAEFSRSNYIWNTTSTDSAIIVFDEDNYWATVTNLCGSHSDSIFIDVDSVLTVDLGSDTILCIGEKTTLFSNVTADSYLWSTGNITDSLIVLNQNKYHLSVTNVCGTYTDSVYVYYDNSPITNLGPDSTYCLNSLVNLNAHWSRANYLWSTADTTANITANFNGNYSVKVINLCGYDGDTINIQYDIPIQFNLGTDTVLCQGDSLLLLAPAHNASWLWNTGKTDSSLTINTGGVYRVTATNICGHFHDSIHITDQILPVINPIIKDTSFCEGNTFLVDVNRNNANAILWLNGHDEFTYEFDSSGVYSYSLINICGSTSDTFQLKMNHLANASLGNDTLICYGEEIVKSFPYKNHTYQWNNGATDSFRIITKPGIYGVTIFTPEGCENSDDLEVLNCESQLFIPNAFTPNNGDELNNTFAIKGEGIRKFHLIIYDRWGMEVYQSTDLSQSWNGTINGEDVAPGVYSYKVWYNTGMSSQSITKYGHFTLIR